MLCFSVLVFVRGLARKPERAELSFLGRYLSMYIFQVFVDFNSSSSILPHRLIPSFDILTLDILPVFSSIGFSSLILLLSFPCLLSRQPDPNSDAD